MRESRRLELKKRVSDSFLKSVSAYANYGDGMILFGVTDDGLELGLLSRKMTLSMRLLVQPADKDLIQLRGAGGTTNYMMNRG